MDEVRKVKAITIVTAQGVKAFYSDESDEIIIADYWIAGDPYNCFKVVNRKTREVKNEIRCMHNIEIEYFSGKLTNGHN